MTSNANLTATKMHQRDGSSFWQTYPLTQEIRQDAWMENIVQLYSAQCMEAEHVITFTIAEVFEGLK